MEALSPAYLRSRVRVHFQNKQDVRCSDCSQVTFENIVEAAAEATTRGSPCLSTPIEDAARDAGEDVCGNTISIGCDLQKMQLVHIKTFEEEDILPGIVLEFRWDPKILISIVSQKGDRIVARKVLVMALERFRRTSNLRKILALKGLPTCDIRENPYLRSGHPPHDNFVESLLDYFETETPGGLTDCPLFEHLLESAADDAGAESFDAIERGAIRTVFHGTNHAVMEAILYSGLDPDCRSGGLQEDYFGVEYETSLGYTAEKTVPRPNRFKLLLFMVLNVEEPRQKVIWTKFAKVVTVSSNKFELPIAEITLSHTVEELIDKSIIHNRPCMPACMIQTLLLARKDGPIFGRLSGRLQIQ